MDVVRSLISVDGLEICGMPHDLKFSRNSIPTVHVSRGSSDFKRLAAIIAFDETDCFGNQFARLEPSPDPQRCLKSERDLRHHIGKLQLDQLVGSKWFSKLFAIESIASRCSITEFCCSH